MRLLLRSLSCALLVACSTTELEFEPGFDPFPDDADAPSTGRDAGDASATEAGPAPLDARVADARAADARALDGAQLQPVCAAREVCSNSGLTSVTLCTAQVPGVSTPSAGLHDVCLFDPQSRLFVTRLRGDLRVTNPGWTFSSYSVVRSTLSASDTTRCQRALAAQVATRCVPGFDMATRDAGIVVPNAISCSDLDRTISLNLDDAARLVSISCMADSDCAAWTPRFECPNMRARLEYCPRALAQSQVMLANSFVDQMETLLCPRVTGPNCGSSPSCNVQVARCIERTCRMRR